LTWSSQENSSGSVFSSQYAMVSSLRPERPRQQLIRGCVHADAPAENIGHRARDRHFHALFLRHFDEYGRGENSFRELRAGLARRMAFPHGDAKGIIARLRARAGEDQV